MGVTKFRRKVVGGQAEFKDTVVCLKGTLSAATKEMFGVANPLGADLIVTQAIIDITSPCSATPVTFDCGCAASTITTSNNNLMDGVNIGTPTGIAVYNSEDNKGDNGAMSRKWASDKYFTIVASATPTGVVGNVYIYYRKA